MKRWAQGCLAGAAGTTALNAVTYLDMALRGRSSSETPETMVEKTVRSLGADIPGDEEHRGNRLSALGALSGIITGVSVGSVAGFLPLRRPYSSASAVLLRGLVIGGFAMLAANAPLAWSGVSDPRDWSVADWASDALPHLAYGLTAAGTLALADR